MSISKFNHSSPFTYQADKETPFVKLADLVKEANDPGKVFRIRALYVNQKSRYGDSPVAVCDGYNVNLPSHLLNDVRAIIQDAEVVADINACKCGFTIKPYVNSRGTTSYTINWVEIKEDLPF